MDWRTITFDWNRARAFLVAAREGSFSAAGRALGLSQPTVGRQVAALEEELGVALIERVGRSFALTEAGAEVAEHLGAMAEAATRASLAAAGQSSSLEGNVSVTASEIITAVLLPPIVATVRAAHPGITLELVASNDVRDLRRREADIAVRTGRPADPELVGRKIRDGAAYLYGTPAYLASLGPLASPADLARAEILGFDRTERLIAGLAQLGVPVTQRNVPIVTTSHLVQWEMAKRGMGLCFMMAEVGDPEPAVVRAHPELPPLPLPMWVVSHRELQTSQRIRVVFDLLVEGLLALGATGA